MYLADSIAPHFRLEDLRCVKTRRSSRSGHKVNSDGSLGHAEARTPTMCTTSTLQSFSYLVNYEEGRKFLKACMPVHKQHRGAFDPNL